ncbi:hypothetical protein [Nonomuraea pusilla]|uniref:Uncharacterized protein n=1 Tax=Nonomuraea pusilla TaxID=46177 RepID=A0A1H7V8Z4_9ACTN|nr:hypothetical protein [Nonomuraea pusilla]SEM05540.1 hypothetical protein SAMN05660976_04039 [Nonomuraea pusilla]
MSDPYLDAINKGGSLRSPRSPMLPMNPGTGKFAPLAAEAEPLGPRVLMSWRSLARFSVYLVPVAVIAGTAIANEPGMAQAASNWKFGMAARLDDGVKQLLPQIIATSRSGWIALDQQELERVIAVFHREIGVLRNTLSEIGGVIDEIAAGYRSYWVQMATTAATATTLLIAAMRMKAVPVPGVWVTGMILEKLVGSLAIGTVAVFTGMLASMLKEAMDVLSTLLKKDHQFGYVMPSGDAAIDFSQATIDLKGFPSYNEPPAKGALPPGHQNFQWVEPDVQMAQP